MQKNVCIFVYLNSNIMWELSGERLQFLLCMKDVPC